MVSQKDAFSSSGLGGRGGTRSDHSLSILFLAAAVRRSLLSDSYDDYSMRKAQASM
jgi:thiamine pyrophosphokinase